METTGENSGTLCHERHVGDEDERDREREREREREKGTERERRGETRHEEKEERMRGKDGKLTRMMCVSQQ